MLTSGSCSLPSAAQVQCSRGTAVTFRSPGLLAVAGVAGAAEHHAAGVLGVARG